MQITIEDADIQQAAEIIAVLKIGNRNFNSLAADRVRDILYKAVQDDAKHYLFLKDTDNLENFFGCGSACDAIELMFDYERSYRLYDIPEDECPNCREDED